jgi:hypothetical protein
VENLAQTTLRLSPIGFSEVSGLLKLRFHVMPSYVLDNRLRKRHLMSCQQKGQGKLTYTFSAERTIFSADFCRVLEGWVPRTVGRRFSREGGRDTGVGMSSSI